MARTGSTVERTTGEAAPSAQQARAADGDFGAEFRELARQRRFVRADGAAPKDAPTPADERDVEEWRRRAADATARAGSWRAAAAPATTGVARPAPVATAPTSAVAPEREPSPSPALVTASPSLAATTTTGAAASLDPRLTDDHHATLRELARMSDRLVQSREQLAATTTRAEHLAGELEQARAGLRAADERLLASRVLVQDARRATHELAERCAWLEGRCEMLGEALELAVNASWLTRWRWRREQRARASAAS